MAFVGLNAEHRSNPIVSAASRHITISPKWVECVMRLRSKFSSFTVGHAAKRDFGSSVATNGGCAVVAIINFRPIAVNFTVNFVVRC